MKRHLMLAFAIVLLPAFNLSAQTKSRDELLNEIAAKRTELSTLEDEFLSVPDADRTAYTTLLAQSDAGVFRLLPRNLFDSEGYKKARKTIVMRGGGAYYSFVRKTHEYGYGSDIELDQDEFLVGFAGFDFGMMVKLTGAELQDVTAENVEAATLINYEVPQLESSIRREQRRFGIGTVIDGVQFKRNVKAEVGATYLLRSISYETSDVIVAFKAVRKDSDGSMIIAWKLLRNMPVPKAIRNAEAR